MPSFRNLIPQTGPIRRVFASARGMMGFVFGLSARWLRKKHCKPLAGFAGIEKLFRGKCGLEIGGPSSFFVAAGWLPVYDRMAALDGVNFSATTVWTGRIEVDRGFMVDGKRVGRQYILDAVDLAALERNSYDFVLSCNNIEHIANPLKAVEQWLAVLKPGGGLVVVAPRKEANFDHNREIVSFSICSTTIAETGVKMT